MEGSLSLFSVSPSLPTWVSSSLSLIFSASFYSVSVVSLPLSCFLGLSVSVSDYLCLAVFLSAFLSLPSSLPPSSVLVLCSVPLSSFLGRPGSPSIWAGPLEAGPNPL